MNKQLSDKTVKPSPKTFSPQEQDERLLQLRKDMQEVVGGAHHDAVSRALLMLKTKQLSREDRVKLRQLLHSVSDLLP